MLSRRRIARSSAGFGNVQSLAHLAAAWRPGGREDEARSGMIRSAETESTLIDHDERERGRAAPRGQRKRCLHVPFGNVQSNIKKGNTLKESIALKAPEELLYSTA